MGEAPDLTGKLVRVDLRGIALSKEDPSFEGKIGLVIGRDPYVRSWIVLVDGAETRFNSAFLEIINETR